MSPKKLSKEIAVLRKMSVRVLRRLGVIQRTQGKLMKQLRRAFPRKASQAAQGRPGEDAGVLVHVRLLFDSGASYVACVLDDQCSALGEWTIFKERKFSKVVHVRKTAALEHQVSSKALNATDILRVSARLDVLVKVHKLRTMAGMFKTRKEADGSVWRTTIKMGVSKRNSTPMNLHLDTVEPVDTIDTDAEALYALAKQLFPPLAVESNHAAYALSVGLMLPAEQTSVRRCFANLGVAAEADTWFFEKCMEQNGTEAVARFSSDPRFASLLQLPRSRFSNMRVRNFVDKARSWKPNVKIQPAREAEASLADLTLPLVLAPAGAALARSPVYLGNVLRTGVYVSTGASHQDKHPSAVMKKKRDRDARLMCYVYDGLFYVGALKMPAEEREVPYTQVPANLAWASTFINQIDAVAFDGNAHWSDSDIRQALGLAKVATWVFADKESAAATALMARIHACN